MKIIQKIIGLFFFAGAIITYIFYLSHQTTDHVLSFLIPNTIATVVFIFYATISYLYYKNPSRPSYETLFFVMLVIQSFEVEVFGYVFKNYYFPELSLVFNLKELSNIALNYSYFTIATANGHFRNTTDNIVSINLLFWIMIVLIAILSRKVKKEKEAISLN